MSTGAKVLFDIARYNLAMLSCNSSCLYTYLQVLEYFNKTELVMKRFTDSRIEVVNIIGKRKCTWYR